MAKDEVDSLLKELRAARIKNLDVDINENLATELNKIIDKYNLKEYFRFIRWIFNDRYIYNHLDKYEKSSYDKLELARLCLLFYKCIDNTITVNGTDKSTAHKTAIINEDNRWLLQMTINNILYKEAQPIYDYYLSIDNKEDYRFTKLKELYTEEELNKIIKYEEDQTRNKPKGNKILGDLVLTKYYKPLIKYAKFNALQKQLNGEEGEGISREYAIIYDLMILSGDYESIESLIDSEKAKKVRDWIRTCKLPKNTQLV